MFKNRRQYSLIVAACLATPLTAWAGAGYLSVIGPVPLRFLAYVPPVTNLTILPPTNAEPVVTVTEKITNSAPATVVTEVKSQPIPVTNAVPTIAPIAQVPQPDEVVSPQMLLKYFNKSTNGTGTTVIAPLDFNPPRSANPPSSKATYSITP